jgi:hypothetical protein
MTHDPGRLCVCGHPRQAHEHYRAGAECALCPDAGCRRFRPAPRARAILLSRTRATLRRLLTPRWPRQRRQRYGTGP